jgi:hypothetical protein
MADDADRADEHFGPYLQARIAQTARASAGLTPLGRCYNCDEPIRPSLLYCDADCRSDYEAQQRARARSGTMP